jgi:hypothetical protein
MYVPVRFDEDLKAQTALALAKILISSNIIDILMGSLLITFEESRVSKSQFSIPSK